VTTEIERLDAAGRPEEPAELPNCANRQSAQVEKANPGAGNPGLAQRDRNYQSQRRVPWPGAQRDAPESTAIAPPLALTRPAAATFIDTTANAIVRPAVATRPGAQAK